MERRAYKRIVVDIESVFHLDDCNIVKREFVGLIEDISESGFKIVVDMHEYGSIVEQLDVGDKLSYTAIDTIADKITNEDVFLNGDAIVKRKVVEADNICLGCVFTNNIDEVSRYLNNKRVSIYLNKMRQGDVP